VARPSAVVLDCREWRRCGPPLRCAYSLVIWRGGDCLPLHSQLPTFRYLSYTFLMHAAKNCARARRRSTSAQTYASVDT
jgi:hypothetical protein